MIETRTPAPRDTPGAFPMIEWTSGDNATLVESATLGYKEGMTTETRPAPKWRMPISEYTRHLAAKRRSPGTIYLRSYHMRVVSNSFRQRDPFELTAADLERFLQNLGDGHSRNTQRSYLTSLRNFYRWARSADRIDRDPTEYLDSIKPHRGVPRPALWDTIKTSIETAEPRVRLMIQLGATAGLRASEIARVNRADLYRGEEGGWVLAVPRGKGEKPRAVPLLPLVAARIIDTLNESGEEWLFPSNKRGSFGAPIQGKRVTDLVSAALPEGVTCHTLRHTFATTHYKATGNLMAVRDLLGHASLATTEIYTKSPESDARKGINAIGDMLL